MSEKEKAIELIEFFKPIVYSHVGSGFLTGDHNEELILSNAKLCATKCVNEMLENGNLLISPLDNYSKNPMRSERYWVKVKQKIQNYNGK